MLISFVRLLLVELAEATCGKTRSLYAAQAAKPDVVMLEHQLEQQEDPKETIIEKVIDSEREKVQKFCTKYKIAEED